MRSPLEVWEIDWNVNCQAVGSGEATLKYLARYVFKVAISDSRIVRFDDRRVVFRYRKVHSNACAPWRFDLSSSCTASCSTCCPPAFMKIYTVS